MLSSDPLSAHGWMNGHGRGSLGSAATGRSCTMLVASFRQDAKTSEPSGGGGDQSAVQLGGPGGRLVGAKLFPLPWM